MSKDCVDAKASKCYAVVGRCLNAVLMMEGKASKCYAVVGQYRNAVLMMEGKAFKCLQLLSATMYESFAVAGRYSV